VSAKVGVSRILPVVLLLAGCSRGTTIVDVADASLASTISTLSPSVLPGDATRTPGSPTASGSPLPTPQPSRSSGPPQASGVRYPKAEASGQVGDREVSLSFHWVAGYPLYSPPDGVASVAWVDELGNSLSIGADPLFTGTKKTSANATVAISLVDPVTTFNSGDGTCTLTITAADPHYFAGSFSCRNVRSLGGESLTAQGTFESRLNG
jgi:hypothetical protein